MSRLSGVIGESRYDAAEAYEALIVPHHRPIAERLLARAAPRRGEHALELGAGTGGLTRLIAPRLAPRGHLIATDRAASMLELAQRTLPPAPVTFALVDYEAPLPFLDRQFDLVLSQFTYVQDNARSVTELARVLRPGGRVALAMWGPAYGEVRLMNVARRDLGLPRVAPARPDLAVQRLSRAGLTQIERSDVDLTTTFDPADAYLDYRRAFGVPSDPAARRENARLIAMLGRLVERTVGVGKPFDLHWTVTFLTARLL